MNSLNNDDLEEEIKFLKTLISYHSMFSGTMILINKYQNQLLIAEKQLAERQQKAHIILDIYVLGDTVTKNTTKTNT